ncbi:flavodoxin domain-containing protein [Sporolactobacillus pectinivorans]|uniref:flavodoxin domain-containing protein n=1 Tax=Sporolactobacillus pectinivorans TaxID=1591408 RepID=UPI000C2595C1|nr:flavodoxin domain-containing protein [Sporolactobacillus pectinivorans]
MKKILIYATKYGSTAEVAQRLNAALEEKGDLFNVMTDSVPPLDSYETVILGGSIYMGRVQKKLSAYINDHLKELLTKNIALFLCAGHPDEKTRENELKNSFSEALYRRAVAKDILGYAIDFEKMHFFDRLIMSKVKGDRISTAEYFDDRIAAFSKALN